MSGSFKCHHPQMGFGVLPEMVDDGIIVSLTASCETCGAKFRFKGLPMATTPTEAGVSRDGYVALLPLTEVRAA